MYNITGHLYFYAASKNFGNHSNYTAIHNACYPHVQVTHILVKEISSPSSSPYTAVTFALDATGRPMGAPWIRSYNSVMYCINFGEISLPKNQEWSSDEKFVIFKMPYGTCWITTLCHHVQLHTHWYLQVPDSEVLRFLPQHKTDCIHQIRLA